MRRTFCEVNAVFAVQVFKTDARRLACRQPEPGDGLEAENPPHDRRRWKHGLISERHEPHRRIKLDAQETARHDGLGDLFEEQVGASAGVRINVENHTIRLMLTFLLSLLSSALVVFVSRFLLDLDLEWRWYTAIFTAVGNSVFALVLFPILDRLQIRD